jgi:hypothetical protein
MHRVSAMNEVKPPVDDEVAALSAAIAKGAANAMKAVEDGGGVDSVFEAGMRMGITIAMGLATARAIRERRQRDKYRDKALGQGAFYQRHDYRAQAFAEMANAMERWNAAHGVEGDSE